VGWSSRLFVGFALSYDLVLEKLCLMFWIRLREEVPTIGDFNYRNVGLWHRLQVAGYMVGSLVVEGTACNNCSLLTNMRLRY
jgi:hypothetical protein